MNVCQNLKGLEKGFTEGRVGNEIKIFREKEGVENYPNSQGVLQKMMKLFIRRGGGRSEARVTE